MSDPRLTPVVQFGTDVPYAEPAWYGSFHSPYYRPTHVLFREKVRAFVDEHIAPFVDDWEEAGEYPKELLATAVSYCLLANLCCYVYVVASLTNLTRAHKTNNLSILRITEQYEAGVYGAMWPREYGGTPPKGADPAVDGRGVDAFHDLIFWDELARCGSGGVVAAVFLAPAIGLPAIREIGCKRLKRTRTHAFMHAHTHMSSPSLT
jgi:alkylation response protein AidB-like acyl-CoA dehydrogenase